MLQELQQLMGSLTVFSKLEVTSVVVVAIVAGMVIGGLAGTTRRTAVAPLGHTIISGRTVVSRVDGSRKVVSRTDGSRTDGSRGRPAGYSGTDTASGLASALAFAGWAGRDSILPGSGRWTDLSATATYQAGGSPRIPTQAKPAAMSFQQTMVATTMLPLAALPSAGSRSAASSPAVWSSPAFLQAAQQSPAFPLIAPQSPAVPLIAPQSPAVPLIASPGGSPAAPPPGGSALMELRPVAFLPGIYQAAAYRLDDTGRSDAEPQARRRPLWRLGSALFSAARGRTARAIASPAGSPPPAAARPGRHRASHNKRVKRGDKWMRDQ
jgi:hypothetical protein